MARSPFQPPDADRHFCNADSFAAAFDDAWRLLQERREGNDWNRQEILEQVLAQVAHHPFALQDATRAREVGEFRLRLHGLRPSP
jgi:hypothetical protein